jgi:3-deoxy-manno-octulosonate cytidylyltransferase (CMP-KDO synthetase)
MNKNYKVVIPARYESSRFPGKPLADIDGKPMVQHVYECAVASGAEEVIVATDSTLVGMAAEDFGATVCMTMGEHETGTDRLCEVVDKLGWGDETIVVNLQCDHPLTPPDIISQVAINLLDHEDADCSTLYAPIESKEEVEDPNIVKVIVDANGNAMYFSRGVIPYDGHIGDSESLSLWNRHIGLFAYRAGFLRIYKNFPVCDLEKAEKFEHLRIMWNGLRINAAKAINLPGPAVHTEDELEKVKQILAAPDENIAAEDTPE